ncbi:hypothetical protein [Phascolarctobacterium faecium]
MEKVKLLAAFLAGALIASALMFYCAPKPETELPLPTKPKNELTATTSTNVSYTAKAGADDPDAEIAVHAPAVKVKYNDSTYTLPALKNEQYKFDVGKLVVESKTEAALDVTKLVDQLAEAKRPRQAVGIWQTTEGPALSYGYFIAKNKKITIMATIPDTKKHVAVGLEITF